MTLLLPLLLTLPLQADGLLYRNELCQLIKEELTIAVEHGTISQKEASELLNRCRSNSK